MRKPMTFAATAAATLVALAGCAGGTAPQTQAPTDPSSGAPAPGETVKIDFWHGYTEADGKVLDSIVQAFNDSQDEVEITPTTKPWATLLDSLLPALTAGNGPQLVALPPENIPV